MKKGKKEGKESKGGSLGGGGGVGQKMEERKEGRGSMERERTEGREGGRPQKNNDDAGLTVKKIKNKKNGQWGEEERRNEFQKIKESLGHIVELLFLILCLSMDTLISG